MRKTLMAGLLGLAFVGFGTVNSAAAHEPGRPAPRPVVRPHGPHGHDLTPHWHQTRTPFGSNFWYGNGPHDLRPHHHRYTPRGIRSYSWTPFGWTTSYQSYPYVGGPWGR